MATTVNPDTDAQVTYEDQQKINKFARINARLQDVKEELTAKQKELQNLEDAGDELMLQDGAIPYQIGEVFVSLSTEDASTVLEDTKEATKEEIKRLENQGETYKKILQELKVELYAKFGTNINLEAEED